MDDNTIERDTFIVYRSYWEGLKCMDKDVQCEVYNAIMEYGFTGKVPELSKVAQGVFILMKPNIDTSLARYQNGRKGGKASAARRSTAKAFTAQEKAPAMTFDEEIKEMLGNKQWNEPVCMQFRITPEEFEMRMSDFSTHLKCTMDGTGHETIGDAHRHFLSWMRKKYPAPAPTSTKDDPDYTFTGGFGGQDV